MTTRSGPEALRVAAGELRLSGDLPHIAAHLENMAVRWEADRAALEQARALLAELEWCGVDAWLACPWCLGYQDAHPGERHGHAADCKLAALLAAASGGSA